MAEHVAEHVAEMLVCVCVCERAATIFFVCEKAESRERGKVSELGKWVRVRASGRK